jgi:hypothetical protein
MVAAPGLKDARLAGECARLCDCEREAAGAALAGGSVSGVAAVAGEAGDSSTGAVCLFGQRWRKGRGGRRAWFAPASVISTSLSNSAWGDASLYCPSNSAVPLTRSALSDMFGGEILLGDTV